MRPTGPPPEPSRRELVVEEDPTFRDEVLDRLSSLRTFVALATVLSLLALGLAAWALFADDDDDRGRDNGVRAAQVDRLEDRIDELESQPDDEGVPAADVEALAEEQDALAAQVEELSATVDEVAAQSDDAQAAPATAEDAEAREGVDILEEAVGELDARVRQLEQQAP